MDKSWIKITPRTDPAYIHGCDKFLEFAYTNKPNGSKISCPCRECVNRFYESRSVVRGHIIYNGFYPSYLQWTYHGEIIRTDEPENQNSTVGVDGVDDDMVGMVHDAFGVPDLEEFDEFEEGNPWPDEDTKKFLKLLELAKRELYPGCKKFTTLSLVVRLLHLKVLYNMPNVAFDPWIKTFKEALPDEATLPGSFYEANKLKESLAFTYKKYNLCPNNCMLYWKDKESLDKCDFCGEPRYKPCDELDEEDENTKVGRVPRKQMRYFPIKPRLQRLFMSSKTTFEMRWHAEERVDDGILRHPADSLAWKTFDQKYPDFASDCHNVRLGLASDGFSPFRTIGIPHSTWPVVLIPYNLPPWLCMKQSHFILSTLIDGPQAPGMNIDVCLQPLIEDLTGLFNEGIRTYDASSKEMFQMRASLLWTINDFPAYANLSGWSTKGELACPPCNSETQSRWLKNCRKHSYGGMRHFLDENHRFRRDGRSFDGTIETRKMPPPLSGHDVFKQVEHIERKYGKRGVEDETLPVSKRPRTNVVAAVGVPVYNWKKRSIFFELPYWKDNLMRHNLDVMHIEKNVCDSIMNTILSVGKKSKDNLNSRSDLLLMGIRPSLHPQKKPNGKTLLPPAAFAMTKKDKDTFCRVLKDVKVPDGYSSNISRRVQLKDRALTGLKSHDCHVLMQQLLPIALRRTLPKHVVQVLIELCSFFRHICSKTLDPSSLVQLQQKVTLALCHIEKIFPPSFLDIMLHLPVHLADEARIAGPVAYRWMYHVERYVNLHRSSNFECRNVINIYSDFVIGIY